MRQFPLVHLERASLAVPALVAAIWPATPALADYGVAVRSVEANVEYRILRDGFHFATLIETDKGALILRPHPDRSQPDGWGSSWYLNPHRQDAAGEITGGAVGAVVARAGDVRITADGNVPGASASAVGTFSFEMLLTYETATETIDGAGTLDVRLDESPGDSGQDLNLAFVASNRLLGVPLLFRRSFGNTGDMRRVEAFFGAVPSADDETWQPETGPAGHFPQKFTRHLKLAVSGDLNDYDAHRHRKVCGVKRALKPNLDLIFTHGDPILGFGATFATEFATAFEQDNVGVGVQIHQSQSDATEFALAFSMRSDPPSDDLLPAHQPDVVVGAPGRSSAGAGLFGTSECQRARVSARGKRHIGARYLVRHAGTVPQDRILASSRLRDRSLVVRYTQAPGRRNVTAALRAGRHSVSLASGAAAAIAVRVKPLVPKQWGRKPKRLELALRSRGDLRQTDRGELYLMPR